MRLRCPKNHCAINVPDELLGTTIRCPICASLIVVDASDRDLTLEQFKPGDPSVTPESEAAKKEAPDLESRVYDGLPPLSVMIALRKRQGANYDAADFGRRYEMTEDDWKALDAFETVLHAAAALRISLVVCGAILAFNGYLFLSGSENQRPTTLHPVLQIALLGIIAACLYARYEGQAALARVCFGWAYELLMPVTLLAAFGFGTEMWACLRPILDNRSFEPQFRCYIGVVLNGIAIFELCRSGWLAAKAQRQVAPPEISHRLREALAFLN